MSSSINSLNSASFTAITRPSTEGAMHHSRKHHKHHGVDNDSNTTNATTETSDTRESQGSNSNQRNLTRAARDVAHTLRGAGRDASRLLDRIGSNTELADKVKNLSSDFEKTLNDRYDAFVQGGGHNYMDFVEQTAAARRDFRAQLRDIAHNLPTTDTTPPTDPTTSSSNPDTTVDSTAVNTSAVDTIEPGTGPNTGASSPGIDRAQRDIEALVRGLDREGQQYASNPDATAKFNSMRDGFIESVKKEFDSLAQGNTPSYIDFAERVASMRMAFTRDLRTTFGTTSPSNPANPTVDPSAVPQDAAVADLQPRNGTDTGTVTPPMTESGATTVASIDVPATDHPSDATPPSNRNIERARHDAQALLNGLNRDSTRLLNAMGDTPEARQVSARADAFRSMLQDRLKEFVEGGGSNYMDFVGQMASARQSLTNFFHEMAGPKLDHLG